MCVEQAIQFLSVADTIAVSNGAAVGDGVAMLTAILVKRSGSGSGSGSTEA